MISGAISHATPYFDLTGDITEQFCDF